MRSCLIFLFICVSYASAALPLPSYVKPCKDDPKLNECAIQNGNTAIPSIVKGDVKYKVPPLDPLAVTEMVINSASSSAVQLNLTMKDSKILGLSKSQVLESNMKLDEKKIEWTVLIPRFTIVGSYKISGKFLVLPIRGEGPANITLENMKAVISFDFNLNRKKNDEFMKINNANIKYSTSRLYARFENLFNGDKTLSDNMNQVIDDNWEQFEKDMGPAVAKALAVVFKSIISNIMSLVPYKNIFLK